MEKDILGSYGFLFTIIGQKAIIFFSAKYMKKILFIVTEDWYFISHRLKLAKYLRKKVLKYLFVAEILEKLMILKIMVLITTL